jgi:molybdopterin converting factor small subunit
MRLVVRYLAQLRDAAGVGAETVETAAAPHAADLVRRLADAHGGRLRSLLLNSANDVQPTILIFLGDEQIRAEQPVQWRDGDVLTLLTPMAGG